MRRLRRNIKAISPVLAVLMMIAVAIAGSLLVWAWVMGYIDLTTEKSEQQILIQSIANTTTTAPPGLPDLSVFVQNVGEVPVQFDTTECLYVDGVLMAGFTINPPDGVLDAGDTATITVPGGGAGLADKVTVKVVILSGQFSERSAYPYQGGGVGGGPPVLPILDDSFTRADSTTVGEGWVEIDSDPSAEAQIVNNRLDFNCGDDNHQPLVYHTFPQETTGKIKWTFTFNFERTGGENYYEAFMQLGQDLTSAPAGETTGVAVNLKWGGPNDGFLNNEGFGYYDGTTVTQVAIVSGDAGSNPGGDATIEVIADLDAKTFDLTITGAGFISGTASTTGIPFDNSVNIDTVMIYLNGINQANFGDLEIDDVKIEYANP